MVGDMLTGADELGELFCPIEGFPFPGESRHRWPLGLCSFLSAAAVHVLLRELEHAPDDVQAYAAVEASLVVNYVDESPV